MGTVSPGKQQETIEFAQTRLAAGDPTAAGIYTHLIEKVGLCSVENGQRDEGFLRLARLEVAVVESLSQEASAEVQYHLQHSPKSSVHNGRIQRGGDTYDVILEAPRCPLEEQRGKCF